MKSFFGASFVGGAGAILASFVDIGLKMLTPESASGLLWFGVPAVIIGGVGLMLQKRQPIIRVRYVRS